MEEEKWFKEEMKEHNWKNAQKQNTIWCLFFSSATNRVKTDRVAQAH